MYDLLLTRYGSLQDILQMDIDTAIELIRMAFQKREEDRAFQLYAAIYPNFDKKTFKKFSEFYKVQTGPISTRPAEDIMAEAEEIMRKAGEMNRGNL